MAQGKILACIAIRTVYCTSEEEYRGGGRAMVHVHGTVGSKSTGHHGSYSLPLPLLSLPLLSLPLLNQAWAAVEHYVLHS